MTIDHTNPSAFDRLAELNELCESVEQDIQKARTDGTSVRKIELMQGVLRGFEAARALVREEIQRLPPETEDDTVRRALDDSCIQRLGLRLDRWGAHWYKDSKIIADRSWSPSTDSASIPLILAEVERRSLQYEYVEALIALLNVPDLHCDVWPRFTDIFKLMNGTPEQHCRAFLEVTKPST